PSDTALAMMLALPTSAIDLIARSMRQAIDVYWDHNLELGYPPVNISNKPAILADLYQSAGYKSNYEERVEEREGDAPEVGNSMGKWVDKNLKSLEAYKTNGRLRV
ncbi:MAG: hypothetical protein AAFN08_01375, partial [Cyanobacteria bacterium J06559_3]